MLKPVPHLRESERLEELDSYNILDTLSESDYDFITNMAAKITGSPISLISLIDDERQWFKSRFGLAAEETPREYAFCAHAINSEEDVFIVKDSAKDERFYDNPLAVGAPNVIFYAGVTLRAPNDLPLGTLCVIDDKSKDLSRDQISDLKKLGSQVMVLLNLRRTNEQLREVKRNFEKAQELTEMGSWKWDIVEDKAEWSPEMYNIFGVSKDSFYPSNENISQVVLTQDKHKFNLGLDALINNRIFTPFDFKIRRPSGEIRTLHVVGLDKISETKIFGVTQDITNRKMLETEILSQKKLLAERETLLKEVHHRVKNNMQVVSSLMSLQCMGIKDEKLLSKFKEAESRILSMAMVHEQMYNSGNLSEINFGKYLLELYKSHVNSYHTGKGTIQLKDEVEDVSIDMEIAIPCGLIFNEVLTNAFKYAFPEDTGGTVFLSLTEKNGKIELVIADSGIGFDTSVSSKSLGMKLIKSLTKQLKGESIITSRETGTIFKLLFPK